jgi:hypothetical protein
VIFSKWFFAVGSGLARPKSAGNLHKSRASSLKPGASPGWGHSRFPIAIKDIRRVGGNGSIVHIKPLMLEFEF